ncbi:cyclase family protein [Micromonospora profundi]|uniref:Cyclase family protein n=1 Tax=Micromonospora profundi TaxID=1420889 RepID=A0AAJ6HVH7_9ACTN|nr:MULTISPECIES: cyclase family protein [Micromonospora]WLS45323.1 cyclase family protein [Micromonospora profundi]
MSASWQLTVDWPSFTDARVFDLAQQMYTGIPHHPNHPPYSFTLTKRHGEVMYPDGVSAAAEMITTGGHVGTHVDGLAHVSRLGKVYGGVDITANQSYAGGVTDVSVHELAPLLAPGHLVDATVALDRALTPADAVGADLFESWFANRARPRPGDVVLVRTGWDEKWADNAAYLGVNSGAPGVDLSGARWLTDHGVVAAGADTIAFEHMPSPALAVHCHLLVDNGVLIMEAMNLAALSAAQVWDFFFIATPLSIRGGTGSPIRPLAVAPQTTAPEPAR